MAVSVSKDCAKVTNNPKSEWLKVTDFFPPESNLSLLLETWRSFYFIWTTGPGQQSRPCLDVFCYCGEVKRGLLRISCQYSLLSWRQHSWFPAIPPRACLSTPPQPTTRQEEAQAGSMSVPHTGSSLKWIYNIESCRYRQVQWPSVVAVQNLYRFVTLVLWSSEEMTQYNTRQQLQNFTTRYFQKR